MRTTLAIALTLSLTLALAVAARAEKEEKPLPSTLNHKVKTIDGKIINLAEAYPDKVIMVVNVASQCGYTPQYKDLQALYEEYKDKGLVILGFPCNQFGGQEPGSEEDIKGFCESKYGVTFPMFAKIDVKGENQAPLYKVLTSKEHAKSDPGDVKWNFEKILLDRGGVEIARYRSKVNPRDEQVVKTIEGALAKPAK